MMTTAMPAAANNDADLVAATLSGNRDAFGHIVSRYQSLICSLAYSATGSLGQSEDLAQETFITAWKHLGHLRERNKLKAWLCGIARNRINNSLRREGREPVHSAAPLEEIHDSASIEPLPHDQAIGKEEEAILWRSLERIPEIYREPLVLFYREQQSVEAVAEKLELTEDNVHQRLSRGRKLLAEEVTAFVEGALARTNPGKAFTISVLAALPITFATSAKAATVAAATKGGASATGVSLASLFGVLAGPALGLLGGYIGVKASLNNVRTSRERAFVIRRTKITIIPMAAFIAAMFLFSFFASRLWKQYPALFIMLGVVIVMAYAFAILIIALRFNREFAKLRDEERRLHPELFATETMPLVYEYRSRTTLLGLPLVHCRSGRLPGEKLKPAVGWIACGDKAYGIIFASGGVAVGGISFGGACLGLISFGGISVGLLLAFGGVAVGGVAMGGAAFGFIASGGLAMAWHAALGGFAAAHELAVGGSTLAHHANNSVAREFFANHRWLDIQKAGPRNVFWTVCFAPMILHLLMWNWWLQRQKSRRAS